MFNIELLHAVIQNSNDICDKSEDQSENEGKKDNGKKEDQKEVIFIQYNIILFKYNHFEYHALRQAGVRRFMDFVILGIFFSYRNIFEPPPDKI